MMRYQQATVTKEVAVLVGDYQTVDDDAAQKVLATLKKLDPKSMHSQLPAAKTEASSENKNPMRHALVVTNPLLPREYFAAKGVDKFVQDMNKDVPYSLLGLPRKIQRESGHLHRRRRNRSDANSARWSRKRITPRASWPRRRKKAHTLTTMLARKSTKHMNFMTVRRASFAWAVLKRSAPAAGWENRNRPHHSQNHECVWRRSIGLVHRHSA